MSLGDYEVGAVMAVSDMDRAREFYEQKLGLTVLADHAPDGPVSYRCGGGTGLSVYASPDHAGSCTATMAGWSVDDLERIVDELTARGVAVEQYDQPPLVTDEKGIVSSNGTKVAFFRDPDGNTHALNQGMG